MALKEDFRSIAAGIRNLELRETLLPWVFLVLSLSPQLRTLSLTWPSFITEDRWPQLPEYYDAYVPAYQYARRNGLSLPNRPPNVLEHIDHALSGTSLGYRDKRKLLPSRPSWSYWTVFDTNESRFPNCPYAEPDYEVASYTWKAKAGKVLAWNLGDDSDWT
ncbi:hypothetical protein BDZ45DRAFT_696894 [Acephala macrosclerotiorum]|nr:hypothetical protein BDZ45DRAFT_696894 [Acephala macrosclerotiorum]